MVDPVKNTAAVALGRLGGLANTKAQAKARKKNAKRAGRPGRVCSFCHEPVVGGHVDRRLDETCGAHGWTWQHHTAEPVPSDLTLLPDLLDFLTRRNIMRPYRIRLQAAIAAGR